MFVFRVQQTAMVCEHTMEQQLFLVQGMPHENEIFNKISPRLHFLTNDEVDFIRLTQSQYSIVY